MPVTLSPALHKEAEALAQRAMLGDQNAIGMVEEIGKNARAGHAPAQASHPVILAYLESHRGPESLGITDRGAEILVRLAQCFVPPFVGVIQVFVDLVNTHEEGLIEGACAILAEGPEISPQLVAQLAPGVHGEAFEAGLCFAGEPEELSSVHPRSTTEAAALCMGNCLGVAHRWQQVRRGAPLSTLSPNVGWELE
jgi:hypothetical protein